MRIGELAARAGVSVRSVRYYEEQGLLSSTRSPSGQRHYTDEEVERVAFIQRLYTAGLSSRTIAELLPCVDSPSEENSDSALERMAQERDRLSAHITDLARTRDALDALMSVARAHRDQLTSARRDEVTASGGRDDEAASGGRDDEAASAHRDDGTPARREQVAPARRDPAARAHRDEVAPARREQVATSAQRDRLTAATRRDRVTTAARYAGGTSPV